MANVRMRPRSRRYPLESVSVRRAQGPSDAAGVLEARTRTRRGAGHRVIAALCVVSLVVAAIALRALSGPTLLRVRALDVGQGDAFLVEAAGRYVLIDGGPDPRRLLRELGEALPPWERRIDVVALTHEHADHVSGLLAVLARYDVGLVIEPDGMNDVELARLWADRVARSGVRRLAALAGTHIRLGQVGLRILSPLRERPIDVRHLVIRVDAPEGSVLFMSDTRDEAIADLLLAPKDLRARLYMPPHHGADSAYSFRLLEAVRPEAAVISVGNGNRYGHPTPATLDVLAAVPVYRTDRNGTIQIDFDRGQLRIRTERTDGPRPPPTRS